MLLRPYTGTCKTRPVSYFPTRIHQKRTQFYPSQQGYALNAPDFRPKPSARLFEGRMQYAPTRVRAKFDGFWTQTFGEDFFGRMQYAPTRVHEKPGRFWTLPLDMARNPAGFGLCHSTWPETRRVLDFVTRHGVKPGEFWTLSHDMTRNPAGFGLCHSTWCETRRVLDFVTRHGAKLGRFWTLSRDMTQNPAGFGL